MGDCQICNRKASESLEMYRCPRCGIEYCSLACYKHPNHSNCSELFYRQWVENELQSGQSSSKNSTSGRSRPRQPEEEEDRPESSEESVFTKKGKFGVNPKIANFKVDDAAKMDDKTLDNELQQLGIAYPNDVEELLEELTDEEKEHFLKLLAEANLEKDEVSGAFGRRNSRTV